MFLLLNRFSADLRNTSTKETCISFALDICFQQLVSFYNFHINICKNIHSQLAVNKISSNSFFLS